MNIYIPPSIVLYSLSTCCEQDGENEAIDISFTSPVLDHPSDTPAAGGGGNEAPCGCQTCPPCVPSTGPPALVSISHNTFAMHMNKSAICNESSCGGKDVI